MDILDEFNSVPKMASFRLRFASAFIDFCSYVVIGYIIGIFFGKIENIHGEFRVDVSGLPAFFLFLIWFPLIPIIEGLTGQTPGKKICKLEVVKRNFTPTNILTSLIRHLFDIIDVVFFFIGFILIAASKKKRRIGDMVAGTYVIVKE